MRHENVLPLLDAFCVFNPDTDRDDLYLVTPHLTFDLRTMLNADLVKTDQERKFVAYQLFRGLKYLHSGGIMHRDLKPENIGIDDNWDLRILDFGLSRAVNVRRRAEDVPGTPCGCLFSPSAVDTWLTRSGAGAWSRPPTARRS